MATNGRTRKSKDELQDVLDRIAIDLAAGLGWIADVHSPHMVAEAWRRGVQANLCETEVTIDA